MRNMVQGIILCGIFIFLALPVNGLAQGMDAACLAPRLELGSVATHSFLRFLQYNKITPDPAKSIPKAITLKNLVNGRPFTFKQIPGTGSGIYHLFLNGKMFSDSQLLLRETAKEIIVTSLYVQGGADSARSLEGIGTTLLSYLSLTALRKGKDLVLEDTNNYAGMHLAWKHLSANSRFLIRTQNKTRDWRFEELEPLLRSEGIIVEVSSPWHWSGEFALGEGGVFYLMNGAPDDIADQLLVRLLADRKIDVSWRNAQSVSPEWRYAVYTKQNLDKIIIPFGPRALCDSAI